jgi:DNA-3-methyladenine glycosylase I
MERCSWCLKDDLYINYHDKEWGTPVHDDRKHFEFLVLESAQAGLNWYMVLQKRENYRNAYKGFDPVSVAKFTEKDVEILMNNPGIIRNRIKIEASINNAKRFLETQKEFGSFDKYLWNFVDFKPVVGGWKSLAEIPAKTNLSDTVSKDMKKRGFRFLGSTIVYSHLQAVGVVNDHLVTCFRYRELLKNS